MKKTMITLMAAIISCLLLNPFFGNSQEFYQYFDGADTTANNSIFMQIDTSSSNIWQIGSPQKYIFDSAFSSPNVIVSDTVQYYPTNNSSRFQYTVIPWETWGVLAIQWMQKLDIDPSGDGGVIEFSVDGGENWDNVFNNPYVYNFYGYDSINVDTLPTGQWVFTGTDSTWKDLWLCYDMTWLNYNDSIMVRHTLITDSVESNHEGWMMDNFLVHVTIIHTVNEVEQQEYLKVQPNPTSGKIDIVARKIDAFHIIEKMELINMEGKVVQEFGISPTKFSINIGHHPSGVYFLKIQTNIQTESFQIILQK